MPVLVVFLAEKCQKQDADLMWAALEKVLARSAFGRVCVALRIFSSLLL